LKFSSTNIIHGFKTAIAASLSYSITVLLNLDYGHWAVLSTVIVMQVYVADSVEICLYRFIASITGAVIGVMILIIIPESSYWIGCSLFVAIGIYSSFARYKVRNRMSVITIVIIVMTGKYVQDVFIFGLYRVLEICIGMFCAFIVSISILPKRKIDVLNERLQEQAKECSEKCQILVDAFISKQQNVNETLVDDLIKDVWANHELLQKIYQNEALIYQKRFNENMSTKVSTLNRSAERLRNMIRTLNSLDNNGHDIIMSLELEKLSEESGKTLVMVMMNEPSPTVDDLKDAIISVNKKFLEIREKGFIRKFDSKRLIQIFSFYSSLLYFAEDILTLAKNH